MQGVHEDERGRSQRAWKGLVDRRSRTQRTGVCVVRSGIGSGHPVRRQLGIVSRVRNERRRLAAMHAYLC
jgi:hypothetical protein